MKLTEAARRFHSNSNTDSDSDCSSVVAALKDAAAAADIAAQNRRNLEKKLEIIKRKLEIPVKLREAIDDAIEESPESFLRTIGIKLEDLLWENFNARPIPIDATKGLNCDRDTEAEVEVAIRFFPNVLSMKRQHGYYPIHAQLRNWSGEFNLKAVPFIPLLARLGIELSQFEEEERGGLTCYPNVLERLATAVTEYKRDDNEYQRLVDGVFLAVMTRLREMNLFKKEDIRKYDFMWRLCSIHIFPAQRFRYLIDWDPDCLAKYIGIILPIHNAATYCKNISGFRTVFEAGMQHFPTKIGFLFHKDELGRTSYQEACKKYGNEQVEKILDSVALNTTMTTTTAPTEEQHDTVLETLVFAATEERVHLDGVYILLRREPSVLQCQTATRRTIKNDEDGKDDEEEEGDKLWADSNSYPLDI